MPTKPPNSGSSKKSDGKVIKKSDAKIIKESRSGQSIKHSDDANAFSGGDLTKPTKPLKTDSST